MECAYRGVGMLGVDKKFSLEIKADRRIKEKVGFLCILKVLRIENKGIKRLKRERKTVNVEWSLQLFRLAGYLWGAAIEDPHSHQPTKILISLSLCKHSGQYFANDGCRSHNFALAPGTNDGNSFKLIHLTNL